jgi:hypothetical protein
MPSMVLISSFLNVLVYWSALPTTNSYGCYSTYFPYFMNTSVKDLHKSPVRKDRPQVFDTSIFDETLLSNFLEPIDVEHVYKRYQIEKILLPVTGVITPWVKGPIPIWKITLLVSTLLLLVILLISFTAGTSSTISGLDLDEQLLLRASQVQHQILSVSDTPICNLAAIL